MRFTIKSRVKGDLQWVFRHFDEALFRYLLPSGSKLLKFDGSYEGAEVHLKLPVAGTWVSEIVKEVQSANACYFVDEGRELPFPLKEWRHKHLLVRDNGYTVIEDQITYSTGRVAFDLLFKPVLWASFATRKRQYKAYFNKIRQHSE